MRPARSPPITSIFCLALSPAASGRGMLQDLFLHKGFSESEWALTHHHCLISSMLGSPSEGSHTMMLLHLTVCYHIVQRLTDASKHR